MKAVRGLTVILARKSLDCGTADAESVSDEHISDAFKRCLPREMSFDSRAHLIAPHGVGVVDERGRQLHGDYLGPS